jgi:hypothetical protein
MAEKRALWLASLWLTLSGCGLVFGDNTCEDGCAHEVQGSLRSQSGAWGPGSYRFEFSLDGSPLSCTLDVAADATGMAIDAQGCSAGLALSLQNDGHFEFSAQGQPANFGLVVTRDSEEVFTVDEKLKWRKWGPEGADCGRCETDRLNFTAT